MKPTLKLNGIYKKDFFQDALFYGRSDVIDANGYSDRFAVSGKAMHKIAVVYASNGTGMVHAPCTRFSIS